MNYLKIRCRVMPRFRCVSANVLSYGTTSAGQSGPAPAAPSPLSGEPMHTPDESEFYQCMSLQHRAPANETNWLTIWTPLFCFLHPHLHLYPLQGQGLLALSS
jgi:hypothetical protein